MVQTVDSRRIQKKNNRKYDSGPILYWMSRDMRASDNWALLYAQSLAKKYDTPLIVCYNLEIGFEGGGLRQHAFKVGALERIEKTLTTYNIPLYCISKTDTISELITFITKNKIGYVVTDFSPLRIARQWIDRVSKEISIPFDEVDAHNIVPIWAASEKREYAARTIRPKLHKLLPEFLTEFPSLDHHKKPPQLVYGKEYLHPSWKIIKDAPKWDYLVPEIENITPGERAAKQRATHFIKEKLKDYAEHRNDALADAQSDLSPYLHYGNISAQRIALDVVEYIDTPIIKILSADRNGAATKNNASAFLEELIIRRELADNFCYYEPYYDTSSAFPDWAQKTLLAATDDEREYLYDLEELEQGNTHDDLWNAAQLEMVRTGKMHGYMRMYWAKKILEWTEHPDEAMKYAIILNDRYELDGRDPNGYAGIAWSMGGVHDRPWFKRPIFGTVRYMARSGCEKKFDVEKYIEKYNHKTSLFD